MTPARKLYLDNIRWMTVVLVVIYHGIAVCCVGDERTVLSAKPYHKTICER